MKASRVEIERKENFFDGLLKVEDAKHYKIKRFIREVKLQPNQFIYLQDVVDRDFHFKNLEKVLGYPSNKLKADFFIDHIHPADLNMYLKLSKAYRKLICYHKDEIKPFLHSLEMNFRIKTANGSYISVLRMMHPLMINEDNGVDVFVNRCIDVSLLNPTNQIRWKVHGPHACLFNQYVHSKELNKPSLFSGREMEVLELLIKGYSSSRIANALFVSVNTVNTHRKSLMKKANVNKTIDLITYASEYGYI